VELASAQPPKVSENRLGMMVSAVTEQLKRRHKLSSRQGVVVESVTGQAAREAGIQQGDIILSMNGIDVQGVDQFNQLVAELPADRTVAMLVHRTTGPIFLALRVPGQ
jgi:serine protease Do